MRSNQVAYVIQLSYFQSIDMAGNSHLIQREYKDVESEKLISPGINPKTLAESQLEINPSI